MDLEACLMVLNAGRQLMPVELAAGLGGLQGTHNAEQTNGRRFGGGGRKVGDVKPPEKHENRWMQVMRTLPA
jgi:hypothetical protein